MAKLIMSDENGQVQEYSGVFPATTQAEAEALHVDYFDSEEVREHVRESKHCQHGLGFTYDFCPIVNQVNQHEHLKQRIAELEATLKAILVAPR